MKDATIRFEGEAFQAVKWDRCLRDMGFRVSGGFLGKALYVSGGNHVILDSRGFVTLEGQQGYEWHLTLKQTRRWEGTIKFYSVLLAAFTIPQNVLVAHADHVFTSREALRTYAEAAILKDFSLEELVDRGVYRMGDGIQFI